MRKLVETALENMSTKEVLLMFCDDLDLCRQCAAELQQYGQPVVPCVIDAAI